MACELPYVTRRVCQNSRVHIINHNEFKLSDLADELLELTRPKCKIERADLTRRHCQMSGIEIPKFLLECEHAVFNAFLVWFPCRVRCSWECGCSTYRLCTLCGSTSSSSVSRSPSILILPIEFLRMSLCRPRRCHHV